MFGNMYDEVVENMSVDEKIALKNKILNIIANEDLERLEVKLRPTSDSFVFRSNDPLLSSDTDENPCTCTPTFDTVPEEIILFDMFGNMYDEIVENMSMDEKIALKKKILNIAANEDLEGLVLKLRQNELDD